MIDGIGVHWYGGLNTHNLESTHEIAPDKFILATEACNCPGVVYRHMNADEWWQRAEHLGMDILQDLLHWSIGWVDWNLILDVTGGPNHLGNRCDANIIADPKQKLKQGSTLIFQASFYYMGHFSRYLLPGAVRVGLTNPLDRTGHGGDPEGKADGSLEALAALSPDRTQVVVVVMNRNDSPIQFVLNDAATGRTSDALTLNAHAIHTYWYSVA